VRQAHFCPKSMPPLALLAACAVFDARGLLLPKPGLVGALRLFPRCAHGGGGLLPANANSRVLRWASAMRRDAPSAVPTVVAMFCSAVTAGDVYFMPPWRGPRTGSGRPRAGEWRRIAHRGAVYEGMPCLRVSRGRAEPLLTVFFTCSVPVFPQRMC
jgi:hypothetical protein